MNGDLGLHAEIFGRFDQSDPKEFLPEAVDGHARGERVVPRDQPLCKVESIGEVFLRKGWQDARGCGEDFFAR